nr:hypothetical protein [Tanacetum cinerariifolium]
MWKISSLKAKQSKRLPLKKPKNVGKSNRVAFPSSSSSESPSSDNKDLPRKLSPRKISSLKAKQSKRLPLKKPKNVGKSNRAAFPSSSSSESPSSDNKDLPRKFSP